MTESFFNLPIAKNQSIYSFLHRQLAPQTNRLPNSSVTLPDDKSRFGDDGFRWMAGALDGVMGHHAGGGNEQPIEIVNHLIAIAETNSLAAKTTLYDLLCKDNILGCIDQVLEQLADIQPPVEPYLYEFMRLLLKQAGDRGPIKFAIAVLGVIAAKPEVPLIKLFGQHDEFTLYATVALTNILEKPEAEKALWELAQAVDGWGRIQIVERLARTENPEIQEWLIHEGFRNSIMYEYLALICAETGHLAKRLSAEDVDDELLFAAAELLKSLGGGPAPGMKMYGDGPNAVAGYLHHVTAKQPRDLVHYRTIQSLLRWLNDYEFTPQWSDTARVENISTAEAILAFDYWPEMAQAGLQSNDRALFWDASRMAQSLGIPTWDIHWSRLVAQPDESICWQYAIGVATKDQFVQLVELGEQTLPLNEIGHGPALERGLGQQYKWHHCLDRLLQAMRKRPMMGESLVQAGLRSPVIRNRNMALKVLNAWGKSNWSPEIANELKQAHAAEPDEKVQHKMTRLLTGESLDDK